MHSWRPTRSELLLATLLLLGGCAPPPAPVEPPPPPARTPTYTILDESAISAMAELLRMEDRRLLDSVHITGLLSHPEPQVRGRAALAGGRIGDPGAAPLLIAALGDSSAFVRASAAFALGVLGDTSRLVIDSLASLAAGGQPDSVAVEAIAALGRLGNERGRAPLLAILRGAPAPDGDSLGDTLVSPAQIREALLAIWRLPRTSAAVNAVRRHVADPDPETRWRATYALMRFADPSAVEELIELLDDGDPLVRSLARALRAPTVDSAGARQSVLPRLLNALSDPHPHVRINAVNAVATYRDSTTAAAVVRLLGDGDRNAAVAAAQALGFVGGSTAVQALQRVVGNVTEATALRGVALNSLVRLMPDQAAAAVALMAASDDWLQRMYAARALAAAPWSAVSEPLQTLARDLDPRVAAAAVSAIAASADTLSTVRPLYVEALGSYDPGVRAAAASALERIVTPADLDILLQAYEVATADDTNDAALAAIDALGALARQGVPVARSFFLRFERSDDPVVRRRVATLLGTEGWGDPLPAVTDRPLEFYLGVVRDLVAAELAGVPRPRAIIRTSDGDITLELFGADAPLTVRNFMDLAARGFYRNTEGLGSPAFRWHRVVPNFVLQDGDPRGDGTGGPGYAIRDEINRHRFLRGTLGMALSGPDTGGSQFFITHSPQPHLDGGYTVFGRVVAGMEVADQVIQDDPILDIEVIR